jgi:ATP-dependent helicase/nuclease subunit B
VAETDNRVRPAVYTIPAHISFADALAERLLRDAGDDPLDLARTRIFVPNRRAARSLAEAFLRRAGGGVLLPRLQPLGDLDALDDVAVLAAETEAMLPPAVGSYERLLALAPLVQRWAQSSRGRTFNDAEVLKYARALARQIDQFDYAGVSVSDLKNLTPESYAEHWQQILTFLNIIFKDAADVWKTAGKTGPAERRVKSIQALTSVWEATPPVEKIIIAGSTGSIPAVADLMRVIARLPQGAVVLPALDLALDEESWQNLAPSNGPGCAQSCRERGALASAAHSWLAARGDRDFRFPGCAVSGSCQRYGRSPCHRIACAGAS